MFELLGSIVDTKALRDTVLASLAAGIGVTFAFSIAIYGATRTAEARRDDRPLIAIGAGLLFAVSLATCIAAVVLGMIVMTTK